MENEPPDLQALRRRVEDEEKAYASLLAALDSLSALPLPSQALPEMPRQIARLNELWHSAPPPEGGGLTGRAHRSIWGVMTPALERQQSFNALLVQVLNGYFDQSARLHARLAQVVSALVQYAQRVLPVMDARDRLATGLATTRAELILEAFDRRQESLGRRLEGLLALRDRLETVSEQMRAVQASLSEETPPPGVATSVLRGAEDAEYVAFENRFRGSPEDIRTRLADYVLLFAGLAPVVELGCGRGEFLDLMREAGVSARGVESNAHSVAECRARGLDVRHGDLVEFMRCEGDAALGGVFAAQVAEHLPPAVLQEMLRQAHRALRPGGLLALETVNPRSAFGFFEVYIRDLTHERPLHPDTLSFLAAAQGFTDVRVELKSPVDAATRLQPVPTDGLPGRTAEVLNENVARLNGLLYAPQEYVLLARR